MEVVIYVTENGKIVKLEDAGIVIATSAIVFQNTDAAVKFAKKWANDAGCDWTYCTQ